MSEIKHIETDEEFKTIINGDKPVLIDFYAEWCGPCKMMGPLLEDMIKSYKSIDKVEIAKIDIDKLRNLAINFNIMSVPTFMFFKAGKAVKFDDETLLIGMRSQDELIKKFDTLI